MRHLLRTIAALTLLAPVPSALAADTAAPPGVTVIHLTERAERLMARDRLRAGLAVEVTGPVAQQVQAEINRRMEAALAKAKSVSTVKAETGGYSVYPERNPGKPPLWHGQQTLNLSSDAPADLLTLVGDLQQQGLATQGLTFVQQIRDVSVGNAEGGARPPMPMMRAAAGASAPPVAEPGDAQVSVSVQAEIWLAPKGQ
jgi:predicted secreted protein